ncbi:unnamed protein product, partial [Cladocopium goreaui]
TEDASSALSSKLQALRLSFVGRLVVVPCGQPASVAKSSNFFQNLGFDLYVVPVTKQESEDFAIRSPLLVPAWLVREEAGEAEQRALHKAAKDAKQKLKKQRESAYEDDGFEDPVTTTRTTRSNFQAHSSNTSCADRQKKVRGDT